MSAKARLVTALALVLGTLGIVVVASRSSPNRQTSSPGRPTASAFSGPTPSVHSAAPNSQSSPGQASGDLFPNSDAPLLFGVKSTLAEAEAKAGFHIYRPDSDQANDSLIENVWVEETATDDAPWVHVAITYSTGIRMYLLPSWVDGFDRGAEERYTGMAETLGSGAKATSVLGVPALSLEADPSGPAAIDLVVNDVRVQILGGSAQVDASTIVAIAATLK